MANIEEVKTTSPMGNETISSSATTGSVVPPPVSSLVSNYTIEELPDFEEEATACTTVRANVVTNTTHQGEENEEDDDCRSIRTPDVPVFGGKPQEYADWAFMMRATFLECPPWVYDMYEEWEADTKKGEMMSLTPAAPAKKRRFLQALLGRTMKSITGTPVIVAQETT